MPSHDFAGLSQNLADPSPCALTKNFENGRIWGETQLAYSPFTVFTPGIICRILILEQNITRVNL